VVQPLLLTVPTVALIILFPDGRLVARWTRWVGLSSVLLVVAILFLPPAYGSALWPIVLLSALSTQIYRYRRVSTPTERQQTKWVVFGILVWLVLMGLLYVPYALELSMPPGSSLPWWTLASSTGWWLTLTIVPLSLSIAVLKYRLYDIDVVINRALVYGSLTAMLLMVYFGGVATTQAIFRVLTGQEQQPQLAIVVSTLAIAALFSPLHRRIQSLVDRRFYRKKYDARKTLEAFSARLREETDLDALSDDLVGVVRETMQPAHVSMWLRPDEAPRRDAHAL
jgi:hypothetical protein